MPYKNQITSRTKPQIAIEFTSETPVYKQIVMAIESLVDAGAYKNKDFVPSMNQLANDLQISKETVKKAYSILRDKKIIDSTQGKGFYVTNDRIKKTTILLLFDKLSTYKQVLYHSLEAKIGALSEITIRLHNQDHVLFEQFIEENLDKFDYYIVTPHFPLLPEIQKRVVNTLKKIPNRKLILLDRYIGELSGNFGSVYQDFENDIYSGLLQGIDTLKKFKRLNVVSMPGSLYATLIEEGIKRFCTENKIKYLTHKVMSINKIHKHEVFLILNSQLDLELIELIRFAKLKGYKIGEDIGIISYNESPINEIILDGLTVVSTNFNQMGELVADMIMKGSFRKIRCDFTLIRRNTF